MKFIVGLCVFVFIGCSVKNKMEADCEKNEEIVKHIAYPFIVDKNSINEEQIDLSTISDINYLKLETNENCLIPKKWSFSDIYITENYFFISFGQNVFRFDMKGCFLNSIGNKGEAPFEFSNGGIFSVNESLKEVFLLDFPRQKIIVYNYDGIFKRSLNSECYFDRFSVINDTLAVCCNNDITDGDRIFLISLIDGKKKKVLLANKRVKTKKLMVNIGAFSKIRKYENDIYMCVSTSDTIFSFNIETMNLIPVYIQSPLNNVSDEINTVPYLQFESSDYASVLINSSPMPDFTYWIDKKKQIINKVRLYNKDLNDFVLAWGTNRNNVVIDILEMPKLKKKLQLGKLSGALDSIVSSSQEEENPIIMIATFK